MRVCVVLNSFSLPLVVMQLLYALPLSHILSLSTTTTSSNTTNANTTTTTTTHTPSFSYIYSAKAHLEVGGHSRSW